MERAEANITHEKVRPANRLSNVREYYFAGKLREIRRRNQNGADIINLGIGNPDMMPVSDALEALTANVHVPHHHGYQPYKGIPDLRDAFAAWYANSYQVDLNPDQEILPLMGSKEGIMHISMAFLNPGDEILIPNPGYPAYASVARLVGANIKTYNLSEENDWAPDWDALEQMDTSRVKMMWVNYPHMPTGSSATDELFRKIIDFGKRHRILICHDNPYSLVLNEHPRSILALEGAKSIALELNSLSKSHNMAGWRIGMLAGDAEYVQAVLQVKSNMDSGMFLPLQKAAIAALKTSGEWHEERNRLYAQRREIVWDILDQLGCSFRNDQAGMFVWARIADAWENGESLSDHVLDNGRVFITPGFIFGDQGEEFVRISLCNDEKTLMEALKRIQQLRS